MIAITRKEIERLTQTFGDAIYIFNQNEFIENYKDLEDTFRKVYSNYHICYSYKTNYTPAICRCVKELGGFAEVVSDMEYRLAIELGYKPDRIVYNGPIKGQLLKSHLLAGGINNIDRLEEVEYICSIAKENPEIKIKSGIRVNFDIEAGYTSRFGIDINSIRDVVDKLQANNVEINGIHCHMSRARGIDTWKLRARTMITLVEDYRLDNIEYISLGSGMYGKMDPELQRQFPAEVPTYTEYANAVLGQFSAFYNEKEQKPMILTEPGTTLVSKYIDFLGRIIGIKSIRERKFVLLNCSFLNLGETSQMKKLPIRIYECGNIKIALEHADFVGYTCLEQDVLYHDFSGDVSVGDYVLFGNVGGYSIVDKPPFILPNCPMVAINGKDVDLIKRQEQFNDIFSTFVF